jgi:hypothetical protein
MAVMTTNPTNPLTIDNLGIDASKRYAQDQLAFDPTLLQDARLVPTRTERVVIEPAAALPREFSIGSFVLWANFSPPKDYSVAAYHLFTYQLIPGLGGLERIQNLLDQLGAMSPEAKDQPDFKKILGLVQMLERLEKTFALLKANCGRYQQG